MRLRCTLLSGRNPIIALLSLMMLAACAGDSAQAPVTATRDSVDGVPRILYAADGGGTLDWQIDTVTVIGDALGDDPDYQFDNVAQTGLAGGGDGSLYVLDGAGARVLAYDLDGTFQTSFGRRGNGPGELSMAYGLHVRADTVWTLDIGARRFTGYPLDGGPPVVVTASEQAPPTPPFVATRDGWIAQQLQLFNFRRQGGATVSVDEDDQRFHTLVRLDRTAAPADTFARFPMPKQDVVEVRSGDRMMMMMTSPRFSPSLRWAAFDDGAVAVVDSDRYAVRIVGSAGEPELIIERDLPPRAVTGADQDSVRVRMQRNAGMTTSSMDRDMQDAMQQQQLEAMTFATTMPRIAALAIDRSQRIWVGVTLDSPGDIDRIDIFERDGSFVGSLAHDAMPAAFLAGGHAAFLGRDPDLGIQQVTIARIRENGQATASAQSPGHS